MAGADAQTSVRFPLGLPGFEAEQSFLLLRHAALAPLLLLQSEATAGLCFVTLPLLCVAPDYDLVVTERDCETLLLNPGGLHPDNPDLLGLAVVTVPETGPPTANLLAPVVLNLGARVGVQCVRADRRYSHQHPLAETVPCS